MLSIEELVLVTGALCVRAMMSIHPHSGQDSPPMYGDFEAQRHWQELTLNLPVKHWYTETDNNNLTYWGLDYPPLTAYHSLLMGVAADKLPFESLSESVRLETSRGHQSPSHKIWMRATVLAMDALVLAPAVVAFARAVNKAKAMAIVLILLYPGLILIDNGHFQYNNVSLGLMVGAVAAAFRKLDCLSSVLFVCALNYKQMELYHSLPFFFYFLGQTAVTARHEGVVKAAWNLAKIGATVISTFALIWAPLVMTPEGLDLGAARQIALRIFPLQRGLFEDKVANFWCTINVLVKVRELFTTSQLVWMSTAATLTASLPSNLMLLLKPTQQNFLFSLLNTSLAFFLFSFHVHEKTILVVAIPLLMLICQATYNHRRSTLVSAWFAIMTVFSMFPLLQKDKLVLATISLTGCYMVLCHYCQLFEPDMLASDGHVVGVPAAKPRTPVPLTRDQLNGRGWTWGDWAAWTLFNLSVMGCLVLGYAAMFVIPPSRYPDLWPVVISAYSAGHFAIFCLYFNYYQLMYHISLGAVNDSKKRN